MPLADPYVIDVDALPPAVPLTWLSRPVPAPDRYFRDVNEAEVEAERIISDCEARLQGTRPKPSLVKMVEWQDRSGEITLEAVAKEAARAMQGSLGRSKDLVGHNYCAYDIAHFHHRTGQPLPRRAVETLMHVLGLAATVRARARAERLVQMEVYGTLRFGRRPRNADLAKRLRVDVRSVQQLRSLPGVKERTARYLSFFEIPDNLEKLESHVSGNQLQFARELRKVVPNEWDHFGEGEMARAMGAFRASGTATQRAVACEIVYRMMASEAARGEPTSTSLMNVLALVLGVSRIKRVSSEAG